MSDELRFRGLAYAVVALGLLYLFPGCTAKQDWVMFRGHQGQGYTSNAIHPPIAVKWKLRLQVDDKPTLSFNPPVILGDTIYFGSNDGNFYALDIESGYMRWVFKTESAINSIPFADESNVYFGSNDGRVYALDHRDGSELWSFDTGHTVQSTTTRYRDWIVFTSDVGATYFLSPAGEEHFRIPNPVWLYHTFQVYEDVMYFAPGPVSTPLSFGAYDINQRAYLWIIDTGSDRATWYSFPALQGDYLFYSTCGYVDGELEFIYYALDRETGGVIWYYTDRSLLGQNLTESTYEFFRKNLELLDYMAPSIWRNLVVYTSGDTVVRAFDNKSGRLVWKHNFEYTTSSATTIAGDRVYFGLRGDTGYAEEVRSSDSQSPPAAEAMADGAVGRAPKLVCLSASNGRLLWDLDIEGEVLSAPVVAGKWIVFGTNRNYFYVLEEVF